MKATGLDDWNYSTQITSPRYTVGAARMGFSFCFDALWMCCSTWNQNPEMGKSMDDLPAEKDLTSRSDKRLDPLGILCNLLKKTKTLEQSNYSDRFEMPRTFLWFPKVLNWQKSAWNERLAKSIFRFLLSPALLVTEFWGRKKSVICILFDGTGW